MGDPVIAPETRDTAVRPMQGQSGLDPAMLICIAAYVWFAVWLPWREMHLNDFKHMYFGMQALLDGDEPYSHQSLFHQAALQGFGGPRFSLNPYVYLPFTGLAMSFLAPFPLADAAAIWFVLNHIFAVVSCWLIARTLFPRSWLRAFVLLLLALGLSSPMARTLTAGQLNLVLLLCVTSAFCLMIRGRDISAGAVLGFAACFKLAPALFLVYFALRRHWRALGAMVVSIAVCMGISLLAVGWDIHAKFWPVAQQMRYGHSSWEHIWKFKMIPPTFWKDPANQSFNSLFTHLLAGDTAITPWVRLSQSAANAATWAASIALLGTYLWCSRRNAVDVNRASGSVQFSLPDQAHFQATLLLSLLLPSLMWDHYLLLVLLPVAWLVQSSYREKRWTAMRVAAACYTIICVPWQLDAEVYRRGAGLLVMSIKLFPTVVIFGLCCRAALKYRSGTPEIDSINGTVA